MIDSHCHLNFESLSKDLPGIIKRCNQNGCIWNLHQAQWTTKIEMLQDELLITWEKDGRQTRCSFSYGLTRADVDAAISEGP